MNFFTQSFLHAENRKYDSRPSTQQDNILFDQNIANSSKCIPNYLPQFIKSTPLPHYTQPLLINHMLNVSGLPSGVEIEEQRFYPFRSIDHGRPFQYEILLLKGLHYRPDKWYPFNVGNKPLPSSIIISADPNISVHLPVYISNLDCLIIQRGHCIIDQDKCLRLDVSLEPFELTQYEIDNNVINLNLFFNQNLLYYKNFQPVNIFNHKTKYYRSIAKFYITYSNIIINLSEDYDFISKIINVSRLLIDYLHGLKYNSRYLFDTHDSIKYTISSNMNIESFREIFANTPNLFENIDEEIKDIFNNKHVNLKQKNLAVIKMINERQTEKTYSSFLYERDVLGSFTSNESISFLISLYLQCYLTVRSQFNSSLDIKDNDEHKDLESNKAEFKENQKMKVNENSDENHMINNINDNNNYNDNEITNIKNLTDMLKCFNIIINYQNFKSHNILFTFNLLNSLTYHYQHPESYCFLFTDDGVARVKLKEKLILVKDLDAFINIFDLDPDPLTNNFIDYSIQAFNHMLNSKYLIIINSKYMKLFNIKRNIWLSLILHITYRRNKKPLKPSGNCRFSKSLFYLILDNFIALPQLLLYTLLNNSLLDISILQTIRIGNIIILGINFITSIIPYFLSILFYSLIKLFNLLVFLISIYFIQSSKLFTILKHSNILVSSNMIRRNKKPYQPSRICKSNNFFVLDLINLKILTILNLNLNLNLNSLLLLLIEIYIFLDKNILYIYLMYSNVSVTRNKLSTESINKYLKRRNILIVLGTIRRNKNPYQPSRLRSSNIFFNLNILLISVLRNLETKKIEDEFGSVGYTGLVLRHKLIPLFCSVLNWYNMFNMFSGFTRFSKFMMPVSNWIVGPFRWQQILKVHTF